MIIRIHPRRALSPRRLVRRYPRLFWHYRAHRGDDERALDALGLEDQEWELITEALDEQDWLEEHGVTIDTGVVLAQRFGPEMADDIHTALVRTQPWFACGRRNPPPLDEPARGDR